jgi:hypothetical protein
VSGSESATLIPSSTLTTSEAPAPVPSYSTTTLLNSGGTASGTGAPVTSSGLPEFPGAAVRARGMGAVEGLIVGAAGLGLGWL